MDDKGGGGGERRWSVEIGTLRHNHFGHVPLDVIALLASLVKPTVAARTRGAGISATPLKIQRV